VSQRHKESEWQTPVLEGRNDGRGNESVVMLQVLDQQTLGWEGDISQDSDSRHAGRQSILPRARATAGDLGCRLVPTLIRRVLPSPRKTKADRDAWMAEA